MSVKGNLEEKITNVMIKIQKEQTGRGAGEGKSYIVSDMVIVRLNGVLTPAERHLMHMSEGCKLIKELRHFLEEATRPMMEQVIQKITGTKVISMHHDISTKTGESIDVFIMEKDIARLLNK